MADTSIEWTEKVWNPVVGCSIKSPGCTNCYAMKMARRLELMGTERYAGLTKMVKGKAVWTGAVRKVGGETLTQPLKWTRPRRIFVNSMSDLFHEGMSWDDIDEIFAVMALAKQHTFQVLTKRADLMCHYMSHSGVADRVNKRMDEIAPAHWHDRELDDAGGWPLKNVWMGVSAEDHERAQERVPYLLMTPAAVRWVSAEPLIGSMALSVVTVRSAMLRYLAIPVSDAALELAKRVEHIHLYDIGGIDWCVIGGESGRDARPMHPDWVRELHSDCEAGGTAFFFKQFGEWAPREWKNDGATHAIHMAGEVIELSHAHDSVERADEAPFGWHGIARVGKKAAGNTLDGHRYMDYPQ